MIMERPNRRRSSHARLPEPRDPRLGYFRQAVAPLAFVASTMLAAPQVHAGDAAVAAATPRPAERDPVVVALERLKRTIGRYTLDNGLRVVLDPDSLSPVVAVTVTYDVGSRNEGPAQYGFAHLFEHMMFQGSRNVEKGEHFALVAERGGTLNGTTSADRTNYFEVLPADELELALFLEADRMRWLHVDGENFENQRAVVQEEYRMRVANTPYAGGLLRLGELVFADYPPYAHPTIGDLETLAAARLEWVEAFYRDYYAPNNAVVTISGNFAPDEALALAQEYFGAAERRDVPRYDPQIVPPADVAALPRETLRDTNANAPALLWGFRIPPFRDPEHYALEMAALLLASGESSRLHRTLVREQALLQNVSAWTDDHRGPDQLTLFGVANEGTDVARVERAFADALQRLRMTNATADELDRVKSRLRHDVAFGLQSHARRAIRLGEYELFYGDARLYADELEKYLAVSADDVRRAAQRHLLPEGRIELAVLPAQPEAAQ